MKCSSCQNEIEIGDRYITDTASGFIKEKINPEFDGIAEIVFGGHEGKLVYCEDCTEPGGDYLWETNLDPNDPDGIRELFND